MKLHESNYEIGGYMGFHICQLTIQNTFESFDFHIGDIYKC